MSRGSRAAIFAAIFRAHLARGQLKIANNFRDPSAPSAAAPLLTFIAAFVHSRLVKALYSKLQKKYPRHVRHASAVALEKEVRKLHVTVDVDEHGSDGGRRLAEHAHEILELWKVLQAQSFAEKYQPLTDNDHVADARLLKQSGTVQPYRIVANCVPSYSGKSPHLQIKR